MHLARKTTIAGPLVVALCLPGSAQALDGGDLAKGAIAAITIGAVVHSANAGSGQPVRGTGERTATPAAAAFNAYGNNDRIIIQNVLVELGFYQNRVDGAWGPGTDAAVRQYARQFGMSGDLRTQKGADEVMHSIRYTFASD